MSRFKDALNAGRAARDGKISRNVKPSMPHTTQLPNHDTSSPKNAGQSAMKNAPKTNTGTFSGLRSASTNGGLNSITNNHMMKPHQPNQDNRGNLPWHKSHNKPDNRGDLPWHHKQQEDNRSDLPWHKSQSHGDRNDMPWNHHANNGSGLRSANPDSQPDSGNDDNNYAKQAKAVGKHLTPKNLNRARKALKHMGGMKGMGKGAAGHAGKGAAGAAGKSPTGLHGKMKAIATALHYGGYGVAAILAFNLATRAFIKVSQALLNAVNPMNLVQHFTHFISHIGDYALKALHGLAHLAGHVVHGVAHAAHGVGHALLHPIIAAGHAVHAAAHAAHAVLTGGVSAAQAAKVGAVGLALLGSYVTGAHIFFTKTNDQIGCQVQKMKNDVDVGIGSLTGAGKGGDTGTTAWEHKGTKTYKMAQQTWLAAKALGCDDSHAAAMVGNAAHEGMGWSLGWKVTQQGGGPGIGIYQFNRGANEPNGWSPMDQDKRILQEGGHSPGQPGGGLTADQWLRKSGSVASLTESFEYSFEAGGEPQMPERVGFAKIAYQLFKGQGKQGSIGGRAANADANEAAASGAANHACGNAGSQVGSTSNIVQFAKKYMGLKYSEHVPTRDIGGEDIAKKKPKSECQDADCASFAWGVLKACGYKVTSQPWICTNELQGDGGTLKKIPLSQGKPGDVIVDHAHTAILIEPWHGNQTKIINEGGGGGDVNINTYEYSFYSVMSEPLYCGQPVKA